MLKIEQTATVNSWFLGYLTIIDFSIYELIRYMENIFDELVSDLPRLKRIERMFSGLPAIQEYERSGRAITEWCPTKIL